MLSKEDHATLRVDIIRLIIVLTVVHIADVIFFGDESIQLFDTYYMSTMFFFILGTIAFYVVDHYNKIYKIY